MRNSDCDVVCVCVFCNLSCRLRYGQSGSHRECHSTDVRTWTCVMVDALARSRDVNALRTCKTAQHKPTTAPIGANYITRAQNTASRQELESATAI